MKVLVIAPHPDDEILGCGGVIAKRADAGDEIWVCVVSEGKIPMYSKDFIKKEFSEMKLAHSILGVGRTIRLSLPTAMLDTIPQYKINNLLTDVIDFVNPDEVYIPHKGDIHRDHQIVTDSAMVALRPNRIHGVKRILSYEVLSETDWNVANSQNAFIPNVYEDITNQIDVKLSSMRAYKSQLKNYPSARSLEGIKALASHRGITVGLKYAEAFMLIRETII